MIRVTVFENTLAVNIKGLRNSYENPVNVLSLHSPCPSKKVRNCISDKIVTTEKRKRKKP